MDLSKVFDALTAPGSTPALFVGRITNHVFQFIISNINTNVVLKLEGSNNAKDDPPDVASDWFNMDPNGTTVTKTANGSDAFKRTAAVNWIRLTFVSESGGTDAVILPQYVGTSQGGV